MPKRMPFLHTASNYEQKTRSNCQIENCGCMPAQFICENVQELVRLFRCARLHFVFCTRTFFVGENFAVHMQRQKFYHANDVSNSCWGFVLALFKIRGNKNEVFNHCIESNTRAHTHTHTKANKERAWHYNENNRNGPKTNAGKVTSEKWKIWKANECGPCLFFHCIVRSEKLSTPYPTEPSPNWNSEECVSK